MGHGDQRPDQSDQRDRQYTTTPLQLVAGTNSITAVYSGDSNFYKTSTGGSTATALSQTVKPAMTATSVSSSLNPSTYGDLVTFTAVVSNASATAATPTGSVQFVITMAARYPAHRSCAPGRTCVQSVRDHEHLFADSERIAALGAGELHQHGWQFPDKQWDAQSDGEPSLLGDMVSTTTRMTLSPTSSNLGDLVTLTAIVADSSNGSMGTPTGLVTFFANGMPIGTGTLAVRKRLGRGNLHHFPAAGRLGLDYCDVSRRYELPGKRHGHSDDRDGGAAHDDNRRDAQPGDGGSGSTEHGDSDRHRHRDHQPAGHGRQLDSGLRHAGHGDDQLTATLFADGMVLVAGGLSSGAAVNNAYIYNAVSETFTATTGSLITARTGATATLLPNGEILIAGGSSDGTATNALNTAELYNPVTGAFTVAGSGSGSVMKAARFGATATLLTNGQVLIAGGENSNGALSSAELYDPATDTFTATTGPLGTARYDAAAALLANGSVLIAGGTGSGALNSAELYSAGTFASAGTMTAARTGATASLLLNGNVLVAGGSTNTAEIYNPTTPAFTASSSTLSYAPVNGTATLLPNGMVLLVGGASGATAELYDPDGDEFDATGWCCSSRISRASRPRC